MATCKCACVACRSQLSRYYAALQQQKWLCGQPSLFATFASAVLLRYKVHGLQHGPYVAVCITGAVFEASLPSDLAEMYRRLAVLLPQAPIPLVTVLQLWGITDPREAQETVPIFVMQVCVL